MHTGEKNCSPLSEKARHLIYCPQTSGSVAYWFLFCTNVNNQCNETNLGAVGQTLDAVRQNLDIDANLGHSGTNPGHGCKPWILCGKVDAVRQTLDAVGQNQHCKANPGCCDPGLFCPPPLPVGQLSKWMFETCHGYCWSCLPTVSDPMYGQSFLTQISHHALMSSATVFISQL